jgi:hypothetical protein
VGATVRVSRVRLLVLHRATDCTGRGRPVQYPVTVYRAHRADARDNAGEHLVQGCYALVFVCHAEIRTRVSRVRVQRANHLTTAPPMIRQAHIKNIRAVGATSISTKKHDVECSSELVCRTSTVEHETVGINE